MKYFFLAICALLLNACGGGGAPDTTATSPRPIRLASTVSGDTETALQLYQALYGKAPSYTQLNAFKGQIATNGAGAWANATAASLNNLSNTAFATLVLNNVSITATSLTATALFGTPKQAYEGLLAGFVDYLNLVGVGNRGIVAAQFAKIISNLEVDSQFGVYSGAALAFNKQIGVNNTYSANPNNTTAAAVQVANSETLAMDSTFGVKGVVEINLRGREAQWRDIKVQADGKLVLAGYVDGYLADRSAGTTSPKRTFALQRLNADGTVDRTFASNSPVPGTLAQGIGTAIWETGGSTLGRRIEIDSAGNYVVAGNSGYINAFLSNAFIPDQLAFARIKPDGTLDKTLNPTGSLPGTFLKDIIPGGYESLHAFKIDKQGRYVIGGSLQEGGVYKAFVGRMLPTGRWDDTFNSTGATPGLLTFALSYVKSSSETLSAGNVAAISFDSKGNIIIGCLVSKTAINGDIFNGGNYGSGSYAVAFVSRVLDSGNLDTAFSPGSTPSNFSVFKPKDYFWSDSGLQMAVDSKDRPVVAIGNFGWTGTTVFRLNTDGSNDTSFTNSGINYARGRGDPYNISIADNNEILLAQTSWFTSSTGGDSSRIVVTRLAENGSVKSTFGNFGPGSLPGYSVIDTRGPSSGATQGYLSVGTATLFNDTLYISSPLREGFPDKKAVYAINATDGSVKTSYGTGGIAILAGVDNETDSAKAIVQNTAGGYTLLSDSSGPIVSKLNSAGVLDTSFTSTNTIAGSMRVYPDQISNPDTVIQLPDGKLLLTAITRGSGFTVLRLLPDGTVDTSYGNGANLPGTFLYQNGNLDTGHVAMDNMGRLLYAGVTKVAGNYRTVLIRITATGKVDSTFGDGINTYIAEDFGVPTPGSMSSSKVVFSADGKINVFSLVDGKLAVARYLSDGSYDKTFNATGAKPGTTRLNKEFNALGQVTRDAQGRFLAAGGIQGSGSFSAEVIRLTADGVMDTSFANGKGFAQGCACGTFKRIQESGDGFIFAMTGGTFGFYSDPPTIVKFTSAGIKDATFGTNGSFSLAQSNVTDLAPSDFYIDSVGRFVVTASASSRPPFDTGFNMVNRANSMVLRLNRVSK